MRRSAERYARAVAGRAGLRRPRYGCPHPRAGTVRTYGRVLGRWDRRRLRERCTRLAGARHRRPPAQPGRARASAGARSCAARAAPRRCAGATWSARGWPARAPAACCRRAAATRCACCCSRRRMPDSRSSVLAGTLVAEAAGDTLIGAAVLLLAVSLGAAPALGLPGAGTAAWVCAALLVVAGVLLLLARRRGGDGTGRESRLRRTLAGVGRGCAPLTRPGEFSRPRAPVAGSSRAGCAAAPSSASSPPSTCRPASRRCCS